MERQQTKGATRIDEVSEALVFAGQAKSLAIGVGPPLHIGPAASEFRIVLHVGRRGVAQPSAVLVEQGQSEHVGAQRLVRRD